PLQKNKTLTQPADQQAWGAFRMTFDRWSTLSIPDLRAFLEAPPGYEMIDTPKLEMTSVTIFTENSDMADAEGSHTYSDPVTFDAGSAENVKLQRAFTVQGGKVKWRSRPEPQSDNLKLELDVSFAFDMEGIPPFPPFIELGSAITSVTFAVSATFGPGAALNQDRYDKLLRRQREAIGAFDPATVYALAAAAQSDYPGNVIDRAIRENFTGLSLE